MNDDLFQGSNSSSAVTSQTTLASSRPTTTKTTSSSGVNGIFTTIGFIVLGLVVFGILVAIALNAIRVAIRKSRKIKDWKKTVFLEVSVPRETAEQAQKEMSSKKDEKEMIAVGEMLFSVMSDYSQTGFKEWLFGADRFSLEIISVDKEIRFWLICDEEHADVLQRQVSAIYAKANIVRLKKTNFFKENTVSYCQELTLQNRFELPFKTFRLTDTDPLNTLTNAMSGLEASESAAIQLIITPVKDGWQKKPRRLAVKIQQGQDTGEILEPKIEPLKILGKVIGGIFNAFFGKKEEDKMQSKKEREIDLTGKYQQISLTPQQQEIIKKLEEKSSKHGFKFTLRIIASAASQARAKQLVDGIVPAFQVFDIKRFNGFKKKKTNPKTAAIDFLLRAPNIKQPYIINTEEICSIWHLPSYLVNTANIKWLAARKPPIPLEIPAQGPNTVFIGTANARGQSKDVFMNIEDRFRHMYVLGGSGSGKSVLMSSVILQDIKMGNGICVVDPHGELVDDILLRMPPERVDDVIVFSPAITDRPLGLNMLETDPLKPTQKTLVIDTLFTIWDKLYDLKKTGGPMFENYMKNSMRLVMGHPESGCTLMEIPKVLSDEDFRSFKLAMCDEPEVVDFWEKEATKAEGEASLANMVPYITSKLAPFVTNDFIRPMIGQQKSAIDFRQAMDNKKVILVKLEKGLIGENSAYLVGMVIVGGLLMAGMGRNDGLRYNLDGTTTEVLPKDRVPFFVYIDEMQNFLFDAIPKALEEIRKYKVGFCLAHQFVKQVITQGDERIKDSIMANCASKFIYRCGADDAQYLEKEFGPTLTANDLMMPERFSCNTILLVDGQKTTPFNISIPPQDPNISVEIRKQIIENTKQKYGKPKEEVEREIRDRAKLLF